MPQMRSESPATREATTLKGAASETILVFGATPTDEKHMEEQRWQLIRRIFEGAVELHEESRNDFLTGACGDDAALRRQVEKLLEADGARSVMLDAGLPMMAAGEEADHQDPAPPPALGAYRLLDEVGRGGMGVVYRAERADGAFDRAVALKLVRGGFDSADVIARFHTERRILANLEHPNVARLYDAGLADDGRPYLVMELVDGEPIDRYCDTHRLSVGDRIRLVRDVCEAVQYAHRNLVIHRDLKPSNVFVDTNGSVRLLDFGIARLIEQDVPDVRNTTRHRPLTPEYASPEQIRGETLTTATDVYSLGAILYELLTGRRPFDGWAHSVAHAIGSDATPGPTAPSRAVTRPAELTRTSGTTESLPPSELGLRRSTTSDRLRRTLRGDLDRILLKALARDPVDRYASVEAFAGDLDRFLAGMPVRAQPPSLAYRARKFVRRHRGGVSAAAVALIVIASAAAVAVQQSRVAAAERDAALGVSAFLEDLFAASDPRVLDVQDTTRMIDFLDATAARIETELADQPRTHARMLLVLGQTYNNIGRSDRAEALLRRAIDANRALHGERHEDVAEAQRVLGLLLAEQDRFDEAIPALDTALATQRSLTGEQSWQVGRLHEALGQALMQAGRSGDAVTHVESSLAIRRAVLEPDDPVITSSLNTLAALKSQLGDDQAAIPLFEEAIELSARLPNTVPEDIGIQRMNLANVLMRAGRHDEALVQARLGHEVLETNQRPWVVAVARGRLAEALVRIWLETRADGLATEADSLFRSGIDLLRTLPEAPQVRFLLHAYAQFLQQRNDLASAETHERESLTLTIAALGPDHPETHSVRASLAGILLDAGRASEAEPLVREAHDVLARELPLTHPARTFTTTNYARALLALDRAVEAVELLESVQEETIAALGEEHPLIAPQRRTLADAYEAIGRIEDAQRVREVLKAAAGADESGGS